MSGISHMLPFVVAGGVMLALSLLLQHLFGRSDITTMMTNVGNAAFRMMYPVLAAFIAYSIADRPGFMPGLMGGYLAQLGTTTAPRLGWISSGFWGAIVAGFAAGLAVRLLNYLFRRIPQELDHIKTGLLVPLLSLLFVGALMVMAINPPLGRFNAWLSIQLDGMQGGSRLVLGTLLGGMMATDYGGPINKAAYVSGTLALVDQQYDLMAAVMAGGMIPPLGIGLACLLFPTRFTSTERCSAPQTLLMGATFVTEGALPFALRDPLRVSLACIAGSALAGFITILLGCGCPAPHGGLFLLPVMENPLGFLIALAVGTLTTALLLGMLKKIFLQNIITKLSYLGIKGGLGELKRMMDSEEVGGAPLLGAAKPVIKAHGSSHAKGIKNAIRQAKLCVANDLCGTMEKALAEVAAQKEEADA